MSLREVEPEVLLQLATAELATAELVAAQWDLLGAQPSPELVRMLVEGMAHLGASATPPSRTAGPPSSRCAPAAGPSPTPPAGSATCAPTNGRCWPAPPPTARTRTSEPRPTPTPTGYAGLLDQVVAVTRLRTVQAPAGFTLLTAPGTGGEDGPDLVPLSRHAPEWAPPSSSAARACSSSSTSTSSPPGRPPSPTTTAGDASARLALRRWVWPAGHRPAGGTLHAKILVVDRTVALVGSANLTSQALGTNLECGVLILGGPQPGAIRGHHRSPATPASSSTAEPAAASQSNHRGPSHPAGRWAELSGQPRHPPASDDQGVGPIPTTTLAATPGSPAVLRRRPSSPMLPRADLADRRSAAGRARVPGGEPRGDELKASARAHRQPTQGGKRL